MGLSIDYGTKIISITSPQTDLTLQELVDFVEDEDARPVNLSQPSGTDAGIAKDMVGKFDKGGGIKSEIILELNSPWQIQFWPGSGLTTVRGGSLVGGLGGVPIKATGAAGDITLWQIPVDGTLIETSTSGLTAAESAKLDAVHGELSEIEASLSHKQVMRLIAAAAQGKLSYVDNGDGTYTATFRDIADARDRLVITGDASGGRDTVVRDAS